MGHPESPRRSRMDGPRERESGQLSRMVRTHPCQFELNAHPPMSSSDLYSFTLTRAQNFFFCLRWSVKWSTLPVHSGLRAYRSPRDLGPVHFRKRRGRQEVCKLAERRPIDSSRGGGRKRPWAYVR